MVFIGFYSGCFIGFYLVLRTSGDLLVLLDYRVFSGFAFLVMFGLFGPYYLRGIFFHFLKTGMFLSGGTLKTFSPFG